ncbi:v-type proton ATPase subunit C 1 [Caerostris darwini]|uniref:V-type proton ATPase subunit C n=1 Tax=Caerostris darwini TaxID=1538125 RepID=A0AAV4NKL9_9ARAC|nr:v-type proton ATPase subunit C 1 [Caerostris darwini]
MKQEKLLEHIANVEKEQATFGSLRPCDSCELVNPFQKTDTWCYNCLCFRRNRKKPKQFWIVSIPGEPSKEEAFRTFNEATQANKLSINYKFHVPELKIGTLDELMYLTEELRFLDDYTEDVLHRLVEFMREVLQGHEHFSKFFEVHDMDVYTYVTRFAWNPVKFPVHKPLIVLYNNVKIDINKLDESMKVHMNDYRQLDRNLENIQKQHTGNLWTRSLAGIVKKEHFVLNSEYLITLLVIVPKNLEKLWLETYQTMSDMVVPNSSTKIFEDNTHMLYNVIVARKTAEEFKKNARQKKFLIRDFEFREKQMEEEKDIEKTLRNLKRAQLAVLQRWIKVNFIAGFSSWIHIKAIRVFVESILRYGLTSNFQAILLVPLKSKYQLRNLLNEQYKNLDSALGFGKSKDVPGPLQNMAVIEYFPYVFFKIKFNFFHLKKNMSD